MPFPLSVWLLSFLSLEHNKKSGNMDTDKMIPHSYQMPRHSRYKGMKCFFWEFFHSWTFFKDGIFEYFRRRKKNPICLWSNTSNLFDLNLLWLLKVFHLKQSNPSSDHIYKSNHQLQIKNKISAVFVALWLNKRKKGKTHQRYKRLQAVNSKSDETRKREKIWS